MSYTAIAVVVSLIVSLCPLLLLARHDPKRLRTIRRKELKPHARRTRQFYSAIVFLPGVVLIAQGEWPAFLIWFGALIACGWLLVQILAEQASPVPIKKPR
jgi:hypothetical protein